MMQVEYVCKPKIKIDNNKSLGESRSIDQNSAINSGNIAHLRLSEIDADI